MENTIVRIAENAAILRQVCDKPVPPTPNGLNVSDHDTVRTLSLKDELDIVSCFTGLSSYSDQPGEVMAMCLEKLLDKKSLVLSIATNNVPSLYLEKTLGDMANILEKQDDGQSLHSQQYIPAAHLRRHYTRKTRCISYSSDLAW
jgi:hypothetical protein